MVELFAFRAVRERVIDCVLYQGGIYGLPVQIADGILRDD